MSFDKDQADRDYDGVLYDRDTLKAEVDALRLALAAAQDEAEKAKAQIVKPLKVYRLEERIAALEAECESLRADKARLDWLEANPAAIRERSVNKSWGRKVWWMGPTGDYHTAREAIDAARADAARKDPPAKAHGCEVGE